MTGTVFSAMYLVPFHRDRYREGTDMTVGR